MLDRESRKGHTQFLTASSSACCLNREIQTSICSREELLRRVTDLNQMLPQILEELKPSRPARQCKKSTCQDVDQVVIGSMDVCSLYPNCKLKEATKHIRAALTRVKTKHVNMDKRFLLKYLALTQGTTNTTLDKYIPTAKGTTTLHSLVFNETPNQFHEAEANPDFMDGAETQQRVAWGIS